MNSPALLHSPAPSCDVVVIGAGAAGLYCAARAGRRGRRAVVLEHNKSVGRKIAISGGGRCNFTNVGARPENFLSGNPNFCRSALARFSPRDFLQIVENHGIAFHEKKLGQMFCNGSSRAIIDMLLRECATAGVEIVCESSVNEVRKSDRFEVTVHGRTLRCQSLVIATGGLSFARLGATDFGYRLARQFGLRVTELRPGLAPLVLEEDERAFAAGLSGVSLPVRARCGKASFEEAMLFTHRGLSGPAILQISSFWKRGEPLEIDLLPNTTGPVSWRAGQNAKWPAPLAEAWPRRLAEAWWHRHAPGKPVARLTRDELSGLDNRLRHWRPAVAGSEGYLKAEVTLGGVDTSCLSSKTMESRDVPGLFFIGEVVDVTGWLGGYNFQWAWASAHAAGEVV